MSNKFYSGTAQQALAYAEDEMRRYHEDEIAAQEVLSIDDAIDDLLAQVEQLSDYCKNANRDDLLNAMFEFSSVQSKFNIVKIKVNQAYYNDDESDDE